MEIDAVIYWPLCLVSGVLTWVLTGLLYRYALARNLLDIPNNRSSHSVATPRGGGVAIVLAFLIGVSVFWGLRWLSGEDLIGILGAGCFVALIGFIDDHRHIAARWRLLTHFVAASWGLYWLGGAAPILLFGETSDLGWVGHLFALVYLVWLLNLYKLHGWDRWNCQY